MSKESDVSFSPDGKESFRARLEGLLKGRSVRVASKAWGLPASTINNYLHKGTEPALKVVVAIAAAENVSLSWLATGLHEDNERATYSHNEEDNLRLIWSSIFDSVDYGDIKSLIKLIHSNGAKGVIAAASALNDANRILLGLTNEEKERLIELHKAKKGTSEEREVNEAGSLTDKRQAG